MVKGEIWRAAFCYACIIARGQPSFRKNKSIFSSAIFSRTSRLLDFRDRTLSSVNLMGVAFTLVGDTSFILRTLEELGLILQHFLRRGVFRVAPVAVTGSKDLGVSA